MRAWQGDSTRTATQHTAIYGVLVWPAAVVVVVVVIAIDSGDAAVMTIYTCGAVRSRFFETKGLPFYSRPP